MQMRSIVRPRIGDGRSLRGRALRALVAAAALLAVNGPAIAHAYSSMATADYYDPYYHDLSASAFAGMETASNGGKYFRVQVKDTNPDGKCAHGAIAWHHVNGSTYYDYGMYVCGFGNYKWFTSSTRDPTKYLWVDVQAWTDGASNPATRLVAWI